MTLEEEQDDERTDLSFLGGMVAKNEFLALEWTIVVVISKF